MPTSRVLNRLEQRGLVRERLHMPSEGTHWELTPEGLARAERILDEVNGGQR